jgi:hypothetical protein
VGKPNEICETTDVRCQLSPRVFMTDGKVQMIYSDPSRPDTRRFASIRRLTLGQWIGMVAGVSALSFGIYFFFNYV